MEYSSSPSSSSSSSSSPPPPSSSSTFLSGNRRPCFIEEDDGLASLADMEAGFSGNNQNLLARSALCQSRFKSSSFRNVSSPRSARFYDARFEDHNPYFLDACFLCKKPLGNNRDIFMYRGDMAFCSEECRQEQIDIDEAEEKNRSLSSSMKALRKKEQRNKSSSSKAQDYSFITDPIAAA